jgi:hypothetical protein
MNKRAVAILALLLLSVAGCDMFKTPPPFDVTGTYRGVWTGVVQGGSPGERSCSVRFDLQHDNSYDFLRGFAVSGTATVYFSCASSLDDIANVGLPARETLNVKGFVTSDGTVDIGSLKADAPQLLTLAVSAQGKDENGDKAMDSMKGFWTLIIDQTGHPRITITGSVDAAR